MLDMIVENDIDLFWDKIDFSKLYGKTIVLAGGTGLLGSYFIYSLYRLNSREGGEKAEVYFVVHNDIPNFLHFIKECDWIHIMQGDISDIDFCNTIPEVDYIIHAAGYGQPGMFMEDKVKTLQINTIATDLLLRKVKKNGRFLFISSSEIYSGSEEYPYTEDAYGCTTPQHKRGCYIEGKRCGEAICMAYHEIGIDVKIARVSLAYGPCFKKNDKRAIYDFIQKAETGKITLLDSGKAQRVYCYISDAMEMLWKIFLEGKEIVYNVGGQSDTSIYNLASVVAKNMDAEVCVPIEEHGMNDAPRVVCMNIDRVCNEFNKKEFVNLDDGVKRTVDWYKEEYKVV